MDEGYLQTSLVFDDEKANGNKWRVYVSKAHELSSDRWIVGYEVYRLKDPCEEDIYKNREFYCSGKFFSFADCFKTLEDAQSVADELNMEDGR